MTLHKRLHTHRTLRTLQVGAERKSGDVLDFCRAL